MDSTFMFFISICAIAAIGIAVIFVMASINTKRMAKNELLREQTKKKKRSNHLYFLCRIYMVTPGVKNYYRRLKKKYRGIIPADEVTINTLVTRQMTKCLVALLAIMIVVVFMCGGSVPYLIMGMLGAYMIFTMMIDSSHEALERKLLDQCDEFISETHANFHDCKDVEESVARAMEGLPYEIKLHAKKIHDIVSSTEIEYEVEQYSSMAPNRFLLLMASICGSIAEYGDKTLENGKSLFLYNLTNLKQELNDERMRLQKKAYAFMWKREACLIPLFLLRPCEALLSKSIPDLVSFYTGLGGLVSMAISAAVTLIIYEYIGILKDDGNDSEESKLLKKVSNIGPIKRFITKMINHNYSKALRQMTMLKNCGSKDTLNVFIIKRWIIGAIFFITVSTIAIVSNHRTKVNLVTDFQNAYSSDLVPSSFYRDQLRNASLALGKNIKTDDDIVTYVSSYVKAHDELDDSMTEIIVSEMRKRQEEYKKTYYKWWVLLISIAASFVGYSVPYILLRYKEKILKQKKDDEVALFRTLILILMHEDGVMVETILEWMKKFSVVFKSSINECLMNLDLSQQESLENMREKEKDYAPFKRLCNSLIAVDNVGLEGAFDDLESERDYYKEKRREDNMAILSANEKKANLFMGVPFIVATALYIGLPFVIYVANMLLQTSKLF